MARNLLKGFFSVKKSNNFKIARPRNILRLNKNLNICLVSDPCLCRWTPSKGGKIVSNPSLWKNKPATFQKSANCGPANSENIDICTLAKNVPTPIHGSKMNSAWISKHNKIQINLKKSKQNRSNWNQSYWNQSYQNRCHRNQSHRNWSHQNWSHQNQSQSHWRNLPFLVTILGLDFWTLETLKVVKISIILC